MKVQNHSLLFHFFSRQQPYCCSVWEANGWILKGIENLFDLMFAALRSFGEKRRKCPPPINSSYRVRSIFMSRFCSSSLSVLYLLIEPFSNMVIGQGFRTGNSTILSAFSIFVYHSHLSALLYFLWPENRVITQLIPLNQSKKASTYFYKLSRKIL